MSKATLESLRAAFGEERQTESSSNTVRNYYPFFSMKSGQHAVVRFLPDLNEDNPRGFLVEKVFHQLNINGQKRTVPCLSMYGSECPVCALSQKFYNAKDELNGKKYWRKKQYLAQALVVDDPLPPDTRTGEIHQGKVRFLGLSYQIYGVIKEAFQSPDNLLEHEPYNFQNGYDFIIKKMQQGDYPVYTTGTRFAVKPRALTEEELTEAAENMVDLSSLLPANPGVERVQTMLDADLNGTSYDENGDNDGENDGPAPTRSAAPTATPAQSQPAATAASTGAQAGGDQAPDFQDLIAQIAARRQQRTG
jgi:hypothetical protein